MNHPLSPSEIRVLGALIEKENTTPEYYPLSLNALVTACNQKTNRWPVVEYDENEALDALHRLRDRGWASEITGGSRVAKYRQKFTEALNLGRRETAILCVLLLRGQQTVGEIKGRCERLYDFSDLEETELVLNKLAEAQLTARLAQAPGMKEPRWAQLLGGPAETAAAAESAPQSQSRLGALEEEVAQLRRDLDDVRAKVEELTRLFQ